MTNQKGKPLLTNREREVFELLVQDKTTKEIAGQLFISEKTVRNHISNVMRTHCRLLTFENNLYRLDIKNGISIIDLDFTRLP
ncbi:helix-turn-helix domain-containing protein [Baia soyae]|uniref:helix-turn-helix domain-containing protein n=1 Tax=Baia soyae TaxID=1544746 RepID=UPI001FB2A60F|nr:helix-turn-helix transcriptional regulator [Baia soyae]